MGAAAEIGFAGVPGLAVSSEPLVALGGEDGVRGRLEAVDAFPEGTQDA